MDTNNVQDNTNTLDWSSHASNDPPALLRHHQEQRTWHWLPWRSSQDYQCLPETNFETSTSRDMKSNQKKLFTHSRSQSKFHEQVTTVTKEKALTLRPPWKWQTAWQNILSLSIALWFYLSLNSRNTSAWCNKQRSMLSSWTPSSTNTSHWALMAPFFICWGFSRQFSPNHKPYSSLKFNWISLV